MRGGAYEGDTAAVEGVAPGPDAGGRAEETQAAFRLCDLVYALCVLYLHALGYQPHAVAELHDGLHGLSGDLGSCNMVGSDQKRTDSENGKRSQYSGYFLDDGSRKGINRARHI